MPTGRISVHLPIVVVLIAVMLTACQTGIPKDALSISQVTVEQRRLQSRRFETSDESRVLSASAAVLQDLGFNLDESETDLGLIVASKDRSAIEADQILAAVLGALLIGVDIDIDIEQQIRVSLVTRPGRDPQTEQITVRVTFQRLVWDSEGRISKSEPIAEARIYQEFFDRLSTSMFLEAQEIEI